MNKTLNIFITIKEIPDISQRQLAKKTGYSLGTINGLLQKLIDQGEIMSKALTPNHYIYEITPIGAIHEAKLVYDFAIDGYKIIGKIKKHIKEIIGLCIKQGIRDFYLYGEKDAIYRLIIMSLIESKRNVDIRYRLIDNIEEIENENAYKVLLWNKKDLDFANKGIHVLIEQ